MGRTGEKTNKKRIKAGSIMLLIFSIIYIPSLLHWAYGNNVTTDILRLGNIEDYINCEGIIIRDETVYKSPYDGVYIKDVEEGGKIPTGLRVATVYRSNSVNYLKQLREIEIQILEAIKEKNENAGVFSRDIARLEHEITRKILKIVDITSKNTFKGINLLNEDIDKLVEKKALIRGDGGFAGEYINTLKAEKENIKRKIDLNKVEIVSENAGIVSYFMDKYENSFSKDTADKLTVQDLSSVEKSIITSDKGVRNIEKDEAFFKVITGIDYFVAIPMEKKYSARLSEGNTVKIRINDIAANTYALVKYIIKEKGDKNLVILSLNKYMTDTLHSRFLNVDIIFDSYEGYIVPLSSLTGIDREKEKASIAIVKGNFVNILDVDIVGINRDFAVIASSGKDSNVRLYDTYVLNPKNIQDGQVIRK